MGKGNGKTEAELDLDRELPPAEGGEGNAPGSGPGLVEGGGISETEKLKAERDALRRLIGAGTDWVDGGS